MMQTIEAQVIDHTLLRLQHPIQLPKLAKVLITVMPVESDERDVWLQSSADQLSHTYSDDEPEYSPEMINNPNPDFKQ